MMGACIVHKMVKGYIVVYVAVIIWIIDFGFLGNTGADKSQLILNVHIFTKIDCCTHQRRLYRHQLGKQFRNIMLYVVDNSWTWLRDTAGKVVFCNVADVRPGSNIRTEAYTEDTVHTHFFKPAKDTLVFIWIVGGKSRGNQKRYFLTFCQISKECFCVIIITSGIVFAGIKAGTTTDAFIPIDLNNSATVFSYCAVCCNDGTDRDTFVTTDTVLIGKYKAFM